jgi:hypothetical protein
MARPLVASLLAALPAAIAGCCCSTPAPVRPARVAMQAAAGALALDPAVPAAVAAERSDTSTLFLMRHVDFHVGEGVVLRVRRLDGEMRSLRPGEPIVFDDKRSFVIHIGWAEVGLTGADLTNLMNGYVFNYRGAPLRNLVVRPDGSQIHLRGILHKVVDIPFEIVSSGSVTPDGRLRLHPTNVKICSIDGGGLMRALGIKLESLLDLSKAKGVTVKGNDLYIEPTRVIPPPAIEGRLTNVRVEGDQLVQTFGDAPGPEPTNLPDPTAANYMRFRGGTLRFGKLFMVHADMQIIDQDPSDPFDFSIDEYNTQLVAGFSRNTPTLGLKVYMPDLNDVGKPAAAVAAH